MLSSSKLCAHVVPVVFPERFQFQVFDVVSRSSDATVLSDLGKSNIDIYDKLIKRTCNVGLETVSDSFIQYSTSPSSDFNMYQGINNFSFIREIPEMFFRHTENYEMILEDENFEPLIELKGSQVILISAHVIEGDLVLEKFWELERIR